MGNLLSSTGAGAAASEVREGRFIAKRISGGITYYYTPFSAAEEQTLCPAEGSQTSAPPSSSSSPSAQLPPLPPSDPPSRTPPQSEPGPASSPRPLLLFFAFLGAKPGAVAKYRDLYLGRGMDVLVVRSGAAHFLWPRWGLRYGLELLELLEEPPFSGRALLVHASSIGGYTFTQVLVHVARRPGRHAGLAHRVMGQIYDSLVVGTLEHMAIGLGKTLLPRFEGLVKNAAMLYFWLFKSHTADVYSEGVRVFRHSPVTAPALFFFSEDDALCDAAAVEGCIGLWRQRGVAVHSRKWRESTHAAHLRRHPRDYLSALEAYLDSLPLPAPPSPPSQAGDLI